MNKVVVVIVVAIALVGMALAWNLLEATAVPSMDAATPAAEEQLSLQQQMPVAQRALTGNKPARVSMVNSSVVQAYEQPSSLTNTPASPVDLTNTPASPVELTNTPVPPAEPTNTPAAPAVKAPSGVSRMPVSVAIAGSPAKSQSGVRLAEQPIQADASMLQSIRQHAKDLRLTNYHTASIKPGGSAADASPQSPTETCMDTLLNSQMNVVEFGDGTGTVDNWAILRQIMYFDNRAGYYHSASYSLAMVDELDGSDTDLCDSTTDCDGFGQGFNAPGGLTSLRVSYYRAFGNANTTDQVLSILWTVDSQGYLQDEVANRILSTDPYSWTYRYWDLSPAELITASGKSLALTFYMMSDRTAPSEAVWLDDAQVHLCYATGALKVYLPAVIKQPAPPVGPVCAPYEPDSVNQRGSTTVGATCTGSFGATDVKDYYTLNLNGATQIRLQLANLPSGTNWDAMIYENVAGYPLACHIGTPGSADKFKDCTLDVSKNYFVLVSAGNPPTSGANTYQMSVLDRAAPGPTPTATTQPSGPTAGFWASTAGDEFYVAPDRANVNNFAIYLNVTGCGSFKITHTSPAPISNNSFSFTGSFYASGTFNSSTTASGTDGLNNFYLAPCGGNITAGPWSWNATWQNSTQPTFMPAVVEPNSVDAITRTDTSSYKIVRIK